MTKKPTLPREWERTLVDDYYDRRWREVLQPLYQTFQRWAAGELSHADMDHELYPTNKRARELYSLFSQSKPFLVRLIQLDADWFEGWVSTHPPPVGVELLHKSVTRWRNHEEA